MTRRDWIRWFAINAVANVIAAFTFDEGDGQATWRDILVAAWPGFVISGTISLLSLVVLSHVAPAVYRRFDSWRRWAILVPVLIGMAVVGTALALGLLVLVGYIEGWSGFIAALRDTIRIAIAVTLVFGIYTTITHALRAQLTQTTLALRTKERDEAEARRIASDAQLASLESRVNPHFFFNTLNSIAELTREDPARAERMTTQLASLMRSSLDQRSTPLVPLSQEVQSVRDYLEIEQTRFGDRLRYEIHVAEDAACAPVPRLALQTLVENCVKYAVSARREGASIAVTAARANGRVGIEVTDDGPGFDAGTIQEGHGLALIRARLELLYGGDATLSVNSRPGRTTVGLVVPAADPDA
jgi:sensor histidine kinase YesM